MKEMEVEAGFWAQSFAPYTRQRISLAHPDSQRCNTNKRRVTSKLSTGKSIANSWLWDQDEEGRDMHPFWPCQPICRNVCPMS